MTKAHKRSSLYTSRITNTGFLWLFVSMLLLLVGIVGSTARAGDKWAGKATPANQEDAQCIFQGTLRIDGEVPSMQNGAPTVELLHRDLSYIRTTTYDPDNGAYGVSAFGRDGLNDSDRVVFRVIFRGDSIIAKTRGDLPIFVGAQPPNPPNGSSLRMIDLLNNHPPKITSTPVDTATEDSEYVYHVVAVDPDTDLLSFALVNSPEWLSVDPGGMIHGIPQAANDGDTTVTVVVSDGYFRGTVTQTYALHVLYTNHAPVAYSQTVRGLEDSSAAITLRGSDVDHDSLSYHVVTPPLHGTLTGTAPNLVYTDSLHFYGTDSLTFTVNDGQVNSSPATVSIVVTHVNHSPAAFRLLKPVNNDTTIKSKTIVFAWHPSSDVDAEDTLTYSLHVSGPGVDTVISGIQDTSLTPTIRSLESFSTYEWNVSVTDGIVAVASADTFTFRTQVITGVRDRQGKAGIPAEYALHQNYPNPFNPVTVIAYELPVNSYVKLSVYNVIGHLVATLKDGVESAGYKSVQFSASGGSGLALPSGMYFYRLEAASTLGSGKSFTFVRKLLLLK